MDIWHMLLLCIVFLLILTRIGRSGLWKDQQRQITDYSNLCDQQAKALTENLECLKESLTYIRIMENKLQKYREIVQERN